MGHHPDDLSKLVARICAFSGSIYVNLPRPLVHRLCWNAGDLVKVEIQGDCVVLSRVPLEELGKARISRDTAAVAAATAANVTDTR